MTEMERELLESAVDRMGWPEIHAFQAEMRKGQSIYEDAGGYFMRGLRRLFGLPQIDEEIITYRRAAMAMVEEAARATSKGAPGETTSGELVRGTDSLPRPHSSTVETTKP